MGCCNSNTADKQLWLDRTPIPFDMNDQELYNFAKYVKIVRCPKGHRLFSEGDEGDKFFIIVSGKVKIMKNCGSAGENVLCIKEENDFFGEAAFEDNENRNASAIADEQSVLLVLSVEDFNKVMSSSEISDNAKESINTILRNKLSTILKEISFLKSFDENQLKILANLFKYVTIHEGNHIFQEGELGEDMYVVLKGSVSVSARTDDGKMIKLEKEDLGVGSYFGEIAMMIDLPRTATVTAASKTLLLRLAKKDFTNFLKLSPGIEEEFHEAVINRISNLVKKFQIPFFEAIPEEKFNQIGQFMELSPRNEVGKTIFNEGEDGHCFYLLIYGKLEVLKKGNDQPLQYFHTGDYFGEISMVLDTPRTASVRVVEEATVLCMAKKDFLSFFQKGSVALACVIIRIKQHHTPILAVLEHPDGLSLFRNFIETEYAGENLTFWEAVQQFKRDYEKKVSQENLLNTAKEIVKNFVEEKAESQVNLSAGQRKGLIEKIMNKGNVDKRTFRLAQLEILMLMEKGAYSRFKKSDGFKKLLDAVGHYEDQELKKLDVEPASNPTSPEVSNVHSNVKNMRRSRLKNSISKSIVRECKGM